MSSISIIGAGGHARSLLNMAGLNELNIFGIYDDSYNPLHSEVINGVELKGVIADLPADMEVILAVGDNLRRFFLYKEYGGRVYGKNIVHPAALIEMNVRLGRSNQIFAGAYMNSSTEIGENNIINTRAIIEHEAVVGNHNHISVGTILCGRVNVGNCCFIGAGAVVIDKISICDAVTVGANAVVVDDIREPGVYAGNPARRIR